MERVTINEASVARTDTDRQRVLDEIARAVDRCLREAIAAYGKDGALEKMRQSEGRYNVQDQDRKG